jgi:hypothetical protein
MQLAQVAPKVASVSVAMSIGTGGRSATYQTFTATAHKPVVGTNMVWERGQMVRDIAGPWHAHATAHSTYTTNPALARRVSAAVLDAYRGFLALGIAPTNGPSFTEAPDRLTIDSADGHWSFARATAPAEALAVYAAATRVLPAR